MKTEDFFGPDGLLAKHMTDFEVRPEQVKMTEFIREIAAKKECAFVEAGTGVGKSLGYLIPLILDIEAQKEVIEYNEETGKETRRPRRVVISTNTKALQSQLASKELPMLQKLFPWLKFAVLVGSENFICKRRLNKAFDEAGQTAGLFGDESEIKELSQWSARSSTGRRMDYPKNIDSKTWTAINRQSDLCMNRKSPYFKECFFWAARAKLNEAHVIIINSHLLCAHFVAGENVIPKWDFLVVDEVHGLESVATEFFGVEVSSFQLNRFVKDGNRLMRSLNKEIANTSEISEVLSEADKAADLMFERLKVKLGEERDTLRLREPLIGLNDIANITVITSLNKLNTLIDEAIEAIGDPQKEIEAKAFRKRAKKMSSEIEDWLLQKQDDHVYQIIKKGKGVMIKSNPINVAPYLRDRIFDEDMVTIGTSATISTGKDMSFIKNKLGAERAKELVLGSPFDYQKQAIFYCASDLEVARSDGKKGGSFDPKYYYAQVDRIAELLEVSKGRGLVLCTSHQTVRSLSGKLKERCPNIRFLIQGEDLPRHQMIEEFRKDPSSVIVGNAASFGEGVDFRGDILTMVIIVKLPFPNIGDPIFEARSEIMDRARPRSSFMNLSLPEMTLKMKQCFGRLIRSSTDWGCVAVLDTRLILKSYGPKVVAALPLRPVYNVNDVKNFFLLRQPVAPPPDEEVDLEEVPF